MTRGEMAEACLARESRPIPLIIVDKKEAPKKGARNLLSLYGLAPLSAQTPCSHQRSQKNRIGPLARFKT
jgi:hypothetical protein